MKRSKPYKWKIENLPAIVQQSKSLTEVLKALGIKPHTYTYDKVKFHIEEQGLDLSHWEIPLNKNSLYSFYSDDELFTDNPKHNLSNRVIKDRLFAGNRENICEICSQKPEWNGKPLVLTLDHKNGNKKDHRKENLRLLCPNCHSQTPTFAGRNRRSNKK